MSNLPPWRYVRVGSTGEWFGASSNKGPWHPIPAPQPPERLFSTPAPAPELPDPTICDRLALVMCVSDGRQPCRFPCSSCKKVCAAVAHELAVILRERHGGSSATADWLDGVGCHQHDAQTHPTT